MDFMMGGIIMFGGDFAPKDWSFCNGQLIAISQNQALFAILGDTWGGDARTNFALPDMRSRVPIGVGRGVGLTQIYQGQMRGTETHTLNVAELATHSHEATFIGTGGGGGDATATVTVNANSGVGEETDPSNNYWAKTSGGISGIPSYAKTTNTTMADGAVTVAITGGGGITGGNVTVNQTGSDQSFSIMNPNLGMQYLIALDGTFPARN